MREKSIRHGHPSTLHLWWARRPLASSRAMLMALLLPDPRDPHCPEAFKEKARTLLGQIRQPPSGDAGLRRALIKFIGAFADWHMAAQSTYLRVARDLVRAAHGEDTPLVVDPFAGGGAIPLEALRLGCDVSASDLNPVACLILKVMLEDIPRHGQALADEVERVGSRVRQRAERLLADLYPPDPDGSVPIAYLWARTVRCEAPECGAEIPLLRSFWLCKKPKRRLALRPRVERPSGRPPTVALEIFEPRADGDVRGATITRAKASCLCCPSVLLPERVRAQLADQRGGANPTFDLEGRRNGGARLLAVARLQPGKAGRVYREPTTADYGPIRHSQSLLAATTEDWERERKEELCPVPDEPLPPIGTLGFRVQRYGMRRWSDLFTARQAVALSTLAIETARVTKPATDASTLAIGKLVDLANSLCAWMPGQECPSAVLKLGRLKMGWDFVEGCPLSRSSGSLQKCTENLRAGIRSTDVASPRAGQALQAMAQQSPLPDSSASLFFTDPPYYDAIPYADLADAFLVWMKRTSPTHPLLRDAFDPDNPLSPKEAEAVQDPSKTVNGSPKDALFFNQVMGRAFSEGKRVLQRDGIGAVVFAHQTTEGWEAFLSGMIRGGWTITASWPIATEMPHRIRARDSAALATSVHLVCRPRATESQIGDWADVLGALPTRVKNSMKRLQQEGIRGADLVFACVGPALELFSRYRRVETAEGTAIGLPEYLEKVWEEVARAALRQVLETGTQGARDGFTGSLEEDARLTALFLWTVQLTDPTDGNEQRQASVADAMVKAATKGFSLPFDVVRRFAQPMGIDLRAWNDRVISQKKGVVRLLPVTDRAKDLFGEGGAENAAAWIEHDPTTSFQQLLFPENAELGPPRARRTKPGRRRGRAVRLDTDPTLDPAGATTLDRVHAAMLLQSSGHTSALRRLIEAEQDRSPDFLRLADALAALYPRGCTEKRLLNAMLLAVPR